MTKSTENELFEKWLDDNYLFDTAEFITNEQEKNVAKKNNIVRKAWDARAELADKEKAELQAQINELREVLELAEHFVHTDSCVWKKVKQALAKTPTQ